jgi:hypothetical protein
VLHWQRLTLGARLDEAERAPALVRRLAGMVGAPDPAAFVSTLEDARRPVAAIFARVLAS